MSAFGSGPSNGQFWYGSTTNFPGFLYKKNVGVGGRRSTKMNPGGGITCNSSTYLYNKYKISNAIMKAKVILTNC
jgi:hypothetical protein